MPSVTLGVASLRDASLRYESTTGGPRWTGAATLALPALSIGGRMAWLNGDFSSADFELGRPTPLGTTGLFLDRVRVGLSLDPLAVRGGATITAGPRVKRRSLVSASGDIELRLAAPLAIDLKGSAKLVDEMELSSVAMHVDAGGWASLDGEVGWSVLSVGLSGRVSGYVSRDAAELTGTVEATALGKTLAGAEAVISNRGVAACRRGIGPDVGFGYRWGGNLDLFASSCDLGPWRAERGGKALRAVGTTTLRLDRAARTAVFAARGEGAPPLIAVTGPSGQRFETPADGSGRDDAQAFIASDPTTNTTYVAVRDAAAGAWTVTSVGAVPIAEVVATRTQPPLDLRATVRRERGGRVVAYRFTPAPGRTVTLVDRAGSARRTIAALRAPSGTVPLRLPPDLERRHEIVAVVAQDGLPVDVLVAARYRATPPAPPAAVARLTSRIRGASATIGWRAAARAVAYEVRTTAPDGRVSLRRIKGTSLRLALPETGVLRVSVRAVDGFGRTGRAVLIRVRRG